MALDEQPTAKRNYANASEQTDVLTKEQSIDMREFEFTKAPINWIPATFFGNDADCCCYHYTMVFVYS
ncbi:hypothetical protein PKHYL_16820 [Psychrobacter sp. KH172YL61]|nr:hypothetical protein PKHYL_16820 [Psychrobacter sp. KH172YL61]